MDFKIKSEGNHYVIYVDGAFYCSCETWTEVKEELKEMRGE